MGFNPFKSLLPGAFKLSGAKNVQQPGPAPTPQSQPTTPPNTPRPGGQGNSTTPQAPNLNRVQAGNISLVTKTPEEALIQVENESADVVFGASKEHKFMETFRQKWALVGPLLYGASTISEICIVLWSFLKEKSYYALMTIAAVSMIAECGLIAVSFDAHSLRARAKRRPGGEMTKQETARFENIKRIWWFLAILVAITQVMFVYTQSLITNDNAGLILFVAIARAAASLVADYYTAYIAEEKENDAEQKIAIKAQQTEYAEKTLEGEARKIEIINAGSVKVQEAAQAAQVNQARTEQKAAMELDMLATERELSRLENQHRINKAVAQHESEAAWLQLQTAAMNQSRMQLAKAAESLGQNNNNVVESKLQTLITEVTNLKKLNQGNQGGQASANTGPLHIVNGNEDDI